MPVLPGNDKDMNESLKQASSDASQAKDKGEQKLASINDHKANLGPVKADNLPEPASKEELKKRAEELNK